MLIILVAGMVLSVRSGKLNVAGAITGGIIGFCLFLGTGYAGVIMMALFFLLGTTATSWKINRKIALGLAELRDRKRTAAQVIANAGAAGLLGLLGWYYPAKDEFFLVMAAAAFASATADTMSSELGNLYGSRFYNVLGFKKDQRGLDGVISMEGTLLGISGSMLIALVYAAAAGWNKNILWIVIAGTFGNITDSILGSVFERRHYLGNNAVNFLNTIFAAGCALALMLLL